MPSPPPTPSYGLTKRLSDVTFEEAVRRVTEALKAEGFGMLTEIDVRKIADPRSMFRIATKPEDAPIAGEAEARLKRALERS